ncbi:hypothetical protein ACLB2K_053369 [Fragaria x ananassa]
MSVLQGIPLVLVLVVLLSLQYGCESQGTPFQYYQLVMRWTKAACYHKPAEPKICVMDDDHVPMRFTLHGMWATKWTNIKDGIRCEKAGTPFDEDEVVYQALADDKIIPAADKTHTYNQIEQAIAKRFRSSWKVVIFCRKVNLTPRSTGGTKTILLLLHEIVFCFDNKAMEKKSCNRKSNCENAKTLTLIN